MAGYRQAAAEKCTERPLHWSRRWTYNRSCLSDYEVSLYLVLLLNVESMCVKNWCMHQHTVVVIIKVNPALNDVFISY